MNTVEKHLEAIRAGYVTKTNISGVGKLFNAYERYAHGFSLSPTTAKFTPLDIFKLDAAIHERQPVVLGELHDSGLQVLRSKRYAKRFQDWQRKMIHGDPQVIFKLIRFDIGTGHDRYAHHPVYRVECVAGDSFCFRNIPWQSGGNGPEIVRDN